MKVIDLANELDLKLLTGEIGLSNEIEGGYVGDLLSVVMGSAKENNIWITIQSHINIVAVASLVNISCIIITQDYKVDEDTLQKAIEEEIPIFTTSLNSYEIIKKLISIGI